MTQALLGDVLYSRGKLIEGDKWRFCMGYIREVS